MFFTPPSIAALPQMTGRATESEDRVEPMLSGFAGPPDLWNLFREPFSQWECSHLKKYQD